MTWLLRKTAPQNLTFRRLNRCHHALSLALRSHLLRVHLEDSKHPNTNAVSHQNAHRQGSQNRTNQHNRRHNRS
jgi:hypothetical protein